MKIKNFSLHINDATCNTLTQFVGVFNTDKHMQIYFLATQITNNKIMKTCSVQGLYATY